jgi:uncharacterized protein involved in response to NO
MIALVLSLTSLFFGTACLMSENICSQTVKRCFILGLFLLLGIIAFIVHYQYDRWSLTAIAIGTGLCLILIALNIYSPQDIAKKILKQLTSKISL